ncbi:MAG: hypothetical protein EAY72_00815, partial [Bacteroidetes bacterium]
MQKFLLTTLLFIGTFISLQSFAQNNLYWRDGFQPDLTPACDLTTTIPTTFQSFYFTGNAGRWYGAGVYLTGGTPNTTGNCPLNVSNFHVRGRNISGSSFSDSPYVITPIVNFGIQEVRMIRGRASRSYTLWVTSDTNAVTATWTNARLIISRPETIPCVDTTVIIASPTAKRLKIVFRPGTDSDVDSIGITSFSQILPVKFGAVSASFNQGKTKLNWQVETEINTSNYVIEQSTNGVDFVAIASVEAKNFTSYNYIFNSINGDILYRIKAIDKDGTFTYSSIIKVKSNASKNLLDLAVAPNPVVNGKLNVQANGIAKGNYTINIFSMLGKQVYSTA